MKAVTTRIPKDLYQKLKKHAIEKESTIQDLFREALENMLSKKS
jgi:hypothetical protein